MFPDVMNEVVKKGVCICPGASSFEELIAKSREREAWRNSDTQPSQKQQHQQQQAEKDQGSAPASEQHASPASQAVQKGHVSAAAEQNGASSAGAKDGRDLPRHAQAKDAVLPGSKHAPVLQHLHIAAGGYAARGHSRR